MLEFNQYLVTPVSLLPKVIGNTRHRLGSTPQHNTGGSTTMALQEAHVAFEEMQGSCHTTTAVLREGHKNWQGLMVPKAKIIVINNSILFISSSAAHVPTQPAVQLPSSATHAAKQDEWTVQLQFSEGASVHPSPPPAPHAAHQGAPSAATEAQGSLFRELRSSLNPITLVKDTRTALFKTTCWESINFAWLFPTEFRYTSNSQRGASQKTIYHDVRFHLLNILLFSRPHAEN